MEDDGTCLLDVINDPDALGAFLTSDQQDEVNNRRSMGNVDIMADDDGISSSSSSKPAYHDFLSMAMAEAELEPDFGGLDQEPFFAATVDSAELGGVPEQRTPLTFNSSIEDTANISADEEDSTGGMLVRGDPLASYETSSAAKIAISAVHRLFSTSSQPLHHGALLPDIPTQKMIHYTAEDHPHAGKLNLLVESTPSQRGGIIQPITIQEGNGQVVDNLLQGLDSFSSHHLTHSTKHLTTTQGVQQQQSGNSLQLNATSQLQTAAAMSPATTLQQQQTPLQQVLIGHQGSGNVQQVLLGSVQPQQIIGANVIQGQASIIQQGHLGHQLLQLQQQRQPPQLRPKMGVVLKHGGVVYEGATGAQHAMKQIQLVLNPQTGVISQMPGNIQLTGQLISQQPGTIGSPQVILQNATQAQQQPQAQPTTSKGKTVVATGSTVSSQPVITMAASEGNIIVLTNSTPLAQPSVSHKSSSTVTVSSSSSTHMASSTVQSTKQHKSKQGKGKTKSRRSQQRAATSKPVATVSVTTVTNSSADSQSQSVQSLGSIPSIQTSTLLSSSPASVPPSAGGPIVTRFGQAVTSSQNNIMQHFNIPGMKQGTALPLRNKDSPSVVSGTTTTTTTTSTVHTNEPAPVISHQTGTVHYRPRQVVPKQQPDKNPALRQLVQNLRAQGDNERLRSLKELQKLLQRNPQASLQLQELMKSKFVGGGTKPELSIKKPSAGSSDDVVTKPPNVYLQPQPANPLPFQTGSKLSGGLTIQPMTYIGKSNARTSRPMAATEVSKNSNFANLSGFLSNIVNQSSSTNLPSEQVRLGEIKSEALHNNLNFVDAKTGGSRVVPSTLTTMTTAGVNQPVVGGRNDSASGLTSLVNHPGLLLSTQQKINISTSSSSTRPFISDAIILNNAQLPGVSDGGPAVRDVSPPPTAPQYSGGLSNAATNLSNNQPKFLLSVQSLSHTNDSSALMTASKADFTSTDQPVIQGSVNVSVKQEGNIGGTSAIGNQIDHHRLGVNVIGRVASPPVQQQAPPLQAAHPGSIQPTTSLQSGPANSTVVTRPTVTLTSEQFGIRAQQQLQQIHARIQQLGSRLNRTDAENQQLQQLLLYRTRIIFKVKAQLAQLSNSSSNSSPQQRLAAALSASMQPRDKPSPVTDTTGPVISASNEGTAGGAIGIPHPQVSTKAGGAFASLLVPLGQGKGNNLSTGGQHHGQVPLASPQQYSPVASPPGGSAPGKQIQNALISSTTSKQDTVKTERGSKHKSAGESEKKNSKKTKTSEPNVTLSQSSNVKIANGSESGFLKVKLEENSSLGNLLQQPPLLPLAAGQLQFQGTGTTSSATLQALSKQRAQLSKTQVKPQQYQQTMKMLEEKLRSMSPAQQRQFLVQYQPFLQKLSLAGQKIMAGKVLSAPSPLASMNSQVEQGTTGQRKLPQGNLLKETKPPKRSGCKTATPTLLQLISGEVAGVEAKNKKHERLIKQQKRSEMFLCQLKKDQHLATHAELKSEFTSRSDAVSKLLGFHVSQDDSPMEEHLDKFDVEFEDHSIYLLEKKDDMLAKYRSLLLRESMTRGPSAEMVMLDRMVLQDERMNFEYEKQLAKNPDDQNRLLSIIKPNQSKKERFLSAAATVAMSSSSSSNYENHAIAVTLKQEHLLPPKKRALIEPVKPPPEPKVNASPELSIEEPQITKNDFKTKITIKIPKQSYQPLALSPAPSSADTTHSTVSSPDLKSPKSEAGSDSSSVRSDISSPRVRLRRHSTLQALLMSDSPLDVSMEELKGKRKPWKQNLSDRTVAKESERIGKSKRGSKEGLTNGSKSGSSVVSEEAMSVFDFDEDTTGSIGKGMLRLLPVSAANSPFEPMDVLQDSLQDEMNSTINSILGLQKASPSEIRQQAKGDLPSAVFENLSNDDDFYDDIDTLSKFTSYSSMLDPGGSSGGGDCGDTVANLQAELDIMMEGDDSQEGRPPECDLEAAVNSIL